MAKNSIQRGLVLSLIAGVDGVTAGTPLMVGTLFVVPATSALQDEPYEAHTVGVWEFPKTAANAPAAGAAAYWNAVAGEITTTVGSNKLVGAFTEARVNGDATCYVRLNGVTVL